MGKRTQQERERIAEEIRTGQIPGLTVPPLESPQRPEFALDLHPIPHRGSPRALENHYLPQTGKAAPSVQSFFARSVDSPMLSYANADIVRDEQDELPLHFIAYWKAITGIQWLNARYGSVARTAEVWGASFAHWNELMLPKPRRNASAPYLETSWIDFTSWRSDHLSTEVAMRLRALSDGVKYQTGIMFSVGDYSATWATDSVSTLALAGPLPRLALHCTNGHSLCDLRMMRSNDRRFNAERFICENDGERYTRTEIAKIGLNALLAGVDEFNYSHLRLLHHADSVHVSETAQAVREVGDMLRAYASHPPKSRISFLHSRTTSTIRAPHYWNLDVPHVFDAALGDGARPEVQCYSWARYLGIPDVIGEGHISIGGLHDVALLIVPNTSTTLLPEGVAKYIDEWIEDGGVRTVFGADGYRLQLREPSSKSRDRFYRLAGREFPSTTAPVAVSLLDGLPIPRMANAQPTACPVWDGPLPQGWEPLLKTADGSIACAWRRREAGGIIHFPNPVPLEAYPNALDRYYAEVIPLLLRSVMEALDGTASAALAVGRTSVSDGSTPHRFVGGAFDGSVARVRLVFDASIAGPAELVLVDLDRVVARSTSGAPVTVTYSKAEPASIYSDPTGRDRALIPLTVIRFTLPDRLELGLLPV